MSFTSSELQTVRLPQLVGLQEALQIILPGGDGKTLLSVASIDCINRSLIDPCSSEPSISRSDQMVCISVRPKKALTIGLVDAVFESDDRRPGEFR